MKKYGILLVLLLASTLSIYAIDTMQSMEQIVIEKSIKNVYGLHFQTAINTYANRDTNTKFISFTSPRYGLTPVQNRNSRNSSTSTAKKWGIGLTITGIVIAAIGIGTVMAGALTITNGIRNDSDASGTASRAVDLFIIGGSITALGVIIITPGSILWSFF